MNMQPDNSQNDILPGPKRRRISSFSGEDENIEDPRSEAETEAHSLSKKRRCNDLPAESSKRPRGVMALPEPPSHCLARKRKHLPPEKNSKQTDVRSFFTRSNGSDKIHPP